MKYAVQMRNTYLILRGYEGDSHHSLLYARIIYYRHRCVLHPPSPLPVIMACNSVITARAILNYGVT